MKPTIGRIVHYWSHGSADGVYEAQCRAAIVTESYGAGVNLSDGRSWEASLAVFNPEGIFLKQDVVQDEKKTRGGTWHWPERDPEAHQEALDEMVSTALKMGRDPGVVKGMAGLLDAVEKLDKEKSE